MRLRLYESAKASRFMFSRRIRRTATFDFCNKIRHKLPPRHLEPVLQALVHDGILKGVRGPHGGYELARERKRITAEDILRAAGNAEEASESQMKEEMNATEIKRRAFMKPRKIS